VIGWKSIKNYSFYILDDPSGKEENPSLATLDTFVRYVLNAPYTDELQRKNKESHYPYWFQYKAQFNQTILNVPPKQSRLRKWWWVGGLIGLGVFLFLFFYPFATKEAVSFSDDFDNVSEETLRQNGWLVQAKDAVYWNRRGAHPGALTLFTLRGDNWRDSVNAPRIQNLLLRKIDADCFTTEVHFNNFVPQENWQQAGILLLEDTNFVGKSLRLSLAYNDFAGGFPSQPEILIQAITSLGNDFSKPEEIVHQPLFQLASGQDSLVRYNLTHTALRIEKQGKRIRLLYANGSLANAAFKELIHTEFDMQVNYVGLFALKSFVEDAEDMPVYVDYFSWNGKRCE